MARRMPARGMAPRGRAGGGGMRRGGGGGARPNVGLLIGGGVVSIVVGLIYVLAGVWMLSLASQAPAFIAGFLNTVAMVCLAFGLAGSVLGGIACTGSFGAAIGGGVVNTILVLIMVVGMTKVGAQMENMVMLVLAASAAGLMFTGLGQARALQDWKRGGSAMARPRSARGGRPSGSGGRRPRHDDYDEYDEYADDQVFDDAPPPPPPSAVPPPPGRPGPSRAPSAPPRGPSRGPAPGPRGPARGPSGRGGAVRGRPRRRSR